MKGYIYVIKNEIMNIEGNLLELRKVISNEISQTQKDKFPMFFVIRGC